MIIFIALGAGLMTFLGGVFAIRFKDKLHLILGFSAGAVLGVALFDLIPESLSIGQKFFSDLQIMFVIALGFMVYMVFDRMFITRECHEEEHHHRGRFSASTLSVHSFFDGVAIGVAFNISPVSGLIVALAVLAHDFSDGINTASMILRHGGKNKEALLWVCVDALAPILGIFVTFFFTFSNYFTAILLALFAGFFLYIGASDLLPESHHSHPTYWTTISTLLGMLFIFGVVAYARV